MTNLEGYSSQNLGILYPTVFTSIISITGLLSCDLMCSIKIYLRDLLIVLSIFMSLHSTSSSSTYDLTYPMNIALKFYPNCALKYFHFFPPTFSLTLALNSSSTLIMDIYQITLLFMSLSGT